jgi:hypothetical protein
MYFKRFEINEAMVLLRFGEMSVVSNRTLIEGNILSILWRHDKFAYILHKLGLYDELTSNYDWMKIIQV